MRWNDEDAWIVSETLTHEPLVSDEQFGAVRTLAAAGRRRPVVRQARPTSQPFALHGLVVCALCHRKTQGSANHGRAHYRCRYPSEYAIANELDHPRNVYVREDQILGPLDGWLAQVFDPGQLDTTLDALEAAADSTDDTDQAKTQAARRRVAECDTRLARYRAALEAGTDPVVVSAWIAEVQPERLAAEVELGRATGQRSRRLSRDQLAALVNGLGNLLGVLASAALEDKAEVYRRLGLRLTYDPGRRVVTVESHLGPDGGRELPGGRRPGGGSGPGASSAEPVGESQCRRGDTRANPTLGVDRRADHPSRLSWELVPTTSYTRGTRQRYPPGPASPPGGRRTWGTYLTVAPQPSPGKLSLPFLSGWLETPAVALHPSRARPDQVDRDDHANDDDATRS